MCYLILYSRLFTKLNLFKILLCITLNIKLYYNESFQMFSNCLTGDTILGPSGSEVGIVGDNASATQEH